jgi:hypothetical protein
MQANEGDFSTKLYISCLFFPKLKKIFFFKVHNTIITTKLLLLFSRMGMNILYCCGVVIDNIPTNTKFTKATIYFQN